MATGIIDQLRDAAGFGSTNVAVKAVKSDEPDCAIKVTEVAKSAKETVTTEVCANDKGLVQSISTQNNKVTAQLSGALKVSTAPNQSSEHFSNKDGNLTHATMNELLAGHKDLLNGLTKAGVKGHIEFEKGAVAQLKPTGPEQTMLLIANISKSASGVQVADGGLKR